MRKLAWLLLLVSLPLYTVIGGFLYHLLYAFPFPISLFAVLVALIPPALPIYAWLLWLGRRRVAAWPRGRHAGQHR